jgi:GT2 family glycosyltransferase
VPRQIKYYQAVTGACLFIKKELFDDMNGFDENYPFGYEDVDLCLRARERCVKISCIQEYDSLHFGSLSNQRHDRHQESKYYFFKCWKGRYSIDGDIKDP